MPITPNSSHWSQEKRGSVSHGGVPATQAKTDWHNETQIITKKHRVSQRKLRHRSKVTKTASNTGQDGLAQSNTDYQKRTQTQTMAQTVWLKVCVKDIQTFSNRAQHRLWYRNTMENRLWHNVTQIMTNEHK